jgi:hypothetical protein
MFGIKLVIRKKNDTVNMYIAKNPKEVKGLIVHNVDRNKW